MIEFAETVLGYIGVAIDFLMNIVKTLRVAFVMLGTASGSVLHIGITFMPTIIGVCTTAVVAVAVIKFLIGR